MVDTEGERFRRKLKNARHDSVTADLLGNESGGIADARLHDGALVTYLRSDEQPHFIFQGGRQTPQVYGSITPKELTRSRRYKVFHVVTDTRWLCVVGNRNGDRTLSIHLEDIEAANYRQKGGLTPDFASRNATCEIAIETVGGFVQIPVIDELDKGDFAQLGSYLESRSDVDFGSIPVDSDEAGYTIDGTENYTPSEEAIANVLDEVPPAAQDEADQIIEGTEDATELMRDLKALIDEYDEEPYSVNEMVADADDADQLRDHVASRSDKIREHAERGIEEARRTFEEADPNEVGRFALQSTKAVHPAIKYSSRSNLWLTATVVAASAIGARRSSNQTSKFDELDPHQLTETANLMAERGADIYDEEARGEAVGAVLGMSSHVLNTMAPDEYAAWVTQADPEAVMEGAEMAAELAVSDDDEISTTTRVAGGSLGLLYGYANQNESMNDETIALPTPE